jgi:hypothetical protein
MANKNMVLWDNFRCAWMRNKRKIMLRKWIFLLILCVVGLAGCGGSLKETPAVAEPFLSPTAEGSQSVTVMPPQPVPTSVISVYAFPTSIDPEGEYLFYLHGKIIEDQGLPAISTEYGEYEYQAILEALERYGYIVISEQRVADTDGKEYASRVAGQVTLLLVAGVPPEQITVVGASKGAGIAVYVSHALANSKINYVLLSICHPDNVQGFIQDGITLSGNVLSIYDASDRLAGSCQELFSFSEGKGINRYEEVVLEIGTGHGILYQPLIEWVLPTVEWGRKR